MRNRYRRGVIFLLFTALTTGAGLVAAGPLPRLAVSLPAGTAPADVARLLQACGAQDVLLVLPPTRATIGATQDPNDGTPQPPAGTPSLPRFSLHLQVSVGELPVTGREREALIERRVSDIVATLGLERADVAGLVIEPVISDVASDLLQFSLATLIVKAKGARPGLDVALVLPDGPDVRRADLSRVLAYADSVVAAGSALAGGRAEAIGAAAAGRPVTVRVPGGAADDAAGSARAFLDVLLAPGAALASRVWVEVPSLAALRGLCTTMQVLARVLGGGLEMTSPERAPAGVLVDGRPAATAVAFVGSHSADAAMLLRSGGSRDAPKVLTLASAAGAKPPQVTCVDAVDGRSLDTRSAPPDRRDLVPACRADTDYVVFHARVPTGEDRLFESVSVTGRASLRVEEIIARWQAARESERAVLENYSVPCFLVLHFEATSLAAGFDVALELQQFWDRSGVNDWVQTAFRVNGVKLRRGQEFPLPQLEPDKVVTKPLELRLDDKYAYELLGTDTVDGRVCYVVGIRPGEAAESLYTGKVWIDGTDFRQVRLRLEQRDGRNNVASHVETQEYGRVKDARGREFTLLQAIDAQDSVNLAGRSITLEKRYRFGQFTINAADFDARLASVRAADDPMFRDTENGMRALRKEGTGRVVESAVSKRITALVAGTLFDGARSFPVPLAGISMVDFDFRKKGAQLSAFFAGPLFIANLSKQVNKDVRWGVDLSLNALPNTFYEYSGNTELAAARVRNFQQFVGGLLNWQVTPALDLSTQLDLYYDVYQATAETAPGYRVPASGVTVDIYGEAKYARKGFSTIGTMEHGHRVGWRGFGDASAPAPILPGWTRYSLEVSQHLFVGKLTRGGVSAGYFGGRDLDRFSRYFPSFVKRPTIDGLPSGVDAFDEVTTLGGYYGFNVLDLAKLQGSYTHAWTRNKDEGNALRQFDGLNFSIGTAGPFGTFVQGSIAVALRGNLERYTTRWGTYLIFVRPWKK
jgi:hypothetical protein